MSIGLHCRNCDHGWSTKVVTEEAIALIHIRFWPFRGSDGCLSYGDPAALRTSPVRPVQGRRVDHSTEIITSMTITINAENAGCSEPLKQDLFWLEFSAMIPRPGGAESNEGLEVFGRPEGVYSQARH